MNVRTHLITCLAALASTCGVSAQQTEQFIVNSHPIRLATCPGHTPDFATQEPFLSGQLTDGDFQALIDFEAVNQADATGPLSPCVTDKAPGSNKATGADAPHPKPSSLFVRWNNAADNPTDAYADLTYNPKADIGKKGPRATVIQILRWADTGHQNVQFQKWYIYDPNRTDTWTYLKKSRTSYEVGTYIDGRHSFRLIIVNLDFDPKLITKNQASESFDAQLSLINPVQYKVNVTKAQTQLQQDALTVLQILGYYTPPAPNAPGGGEPLQLLEAGYFFVYDFDSALSTSKIAISAAMPASVAVPIKIGTPSTLPLALVGLAYRLPLTASGGSGIYTWTASGLPPWLTLSGDGVLTGMPPGPPTSSPLTFQVSATDSQGRIAQATCQLSVAEMKIETPSSLPSAFIGSAYRLPFTVSGGSKPYTWIASGLPPWLTLSGDGVLTGIPPGPATTVPLMFQVTATDSKGKISLDTFQISVSAAAAPGGAGPVGGKKQNPNNPNSPQPSAVAPKPAGGAAAGKTSSDQSNSQANGLTTQNYHNEKPTYLGLSVAVPITSYRDLTYTSGALAPETVNRQNVYVTADFYYPKTEVGLTTFRWFPHFLVGLPIKGQPLRNSLYGVGSSFGIFEPFFGAVLDVQQIKSTAGSPENHFVWKGVYGISISVTALSKALSSSK